jgi:hypothetical protein
MRLNHAGFGRPFFLKTAAITGAGAPVSSSRELQERRVFHDVPLPRKKAFVREICLKLKMYENNSEKKGDDYE